MSFGLPPPLVHGSEIAGQLLSLEASELFTELELPLLPGSELIALLGGLIENRADDPFRIAACNCVSPPPVPPVGFSHCQLPGASPPTNFAPNETDCPGSRLERLHGLVHCNPTGNRPCLTVPIGPPAAASAVADTA